MCQNQVFVKQKINIQTVFGVELIISDHIFVGLDLFVGGKNVAEYVFSRINQSCGYECGVHYY